MLSTDHYLSLAKSALDRESISSSSREMGKAIQAIRLVETKIDAKTAALLEEEVDKLIKVENEIKEEDININSCEVAAAQALNSLALVHLKYSEELASTGRQQQATRAIRIGITHLQNAIDLTTSIVQKDAEMVVIRELKTLLDSLDKHGHLDKATYTLSANDLVKLIGGNQ